MADRFDLVERLRYVANGEATQQVVRSRVNEAVEEISRLRAEITAAKTLLKQLMAVFERSA